MSTVLDKRQAAEPTMGTLAAIARLLVDRRRIVLLLAAIAVAGAALAGLSVGKHLSSGGFTPASAESARADPSVTAGLGASSALGAPSAPSAPAAQAGLALTRRIAAAPGVVYARSYWTTGDPALESGDGRTALILVKVGGNDDAARATWKALMPAVTGRHGPLTVQATGTLPVNAALDTQSAKDLSRAELVAAPLTVLILLAAFGSLLAAGLPLLVGLVSVAGTFAVLRGLAAVTPVSVFAENITTLLGFGLAIDYSLFLVTRYREELARGRPVREAIAAAVSRAGRTVLFSALTVIASLAAMTTFPLYYLRSLAYAGIAVVALAAAASLLILPPVLAVAGHRIDKLDVFAPVRRRLPGSREGRGLF